MIAELFGATVMCGVSVVIINVALACAENKNRNKNIPNRKRAVVKIHFIT